MKDQIVQHAVDNAESIARDPLALVLAGLGISLAPYEFVGGLVLGLAGASIASAMNREQDRRQFWLIMLTAMFVSTMAAIGTTYFYPGMSPQFVMAMAGFASRYIVRIALRVLGLVEDRSDVIADKVVDRFLPDDKK